MSDKVKVYGVDVSTADIQLMTEPASPWRATAATDPANVGAIVARTAIAAGAGVTTPQKLTIPASLITQDTLRQYWANYVEAGPGVRLHWKGMPPSLLFSVSVMRGAYTHNEDNPRGPNFFDIRAGVWYAFTR